MADHVKFPDDFPLACLADVTKSLRDGSWKKKKQTTAEHAWNLVGYGLGAGLSDDDSAPVPPKLAHDGPTPVEFAVPDLDEAMTDEEVATVLEAVQVAVDSPVKEGFGVPQYVWDALIRAAFEIIAKATGFAFPA
jgi:hypothetical protein